MPQQQQRTQDAVHVPGTLFYTLFFIFVTMALAVLVTMTATLDFFLLLYVILTLGRVIPSQLAHQSQLRSGLQLRGFIRTFPMTLVCRYFGFGLLS